MTDTRGPLGLDPILVEILACPCDAHAPVIPDELRELLICTECHRGFPVRDGIPVMLLEESIPSADRA